MTGVGRTGAAAPRDILHQFNMADYFLYDRLQEGRGSRSAIRTRERAWTYQDVAREANRFAGALVSLGVGPGDRVLLSLPDRPEFAAGIFGTLRAGGVVAMANSLLPAEDLAYILDYTGARVLLCEDDVAQRLAPAMGTGPTAPAVIVLDGELPSGPWFHSYRDAVGAASDRFDPVSRTRDDPAYFLFTSGSTGKPKAAVHRHRDFPWNCERYAKQVLGYRPDDVTLSVPKLYFGYATGTNLFFPFSVGATTCLFPEKATPEAIVENVERFRPTILTSVPTSINGMLGDARACEADLSSLRFVLSAGEALPVELHERWTKTFGVEILDGIGSAETFHIYITNRSGDVTPGSLGKLVPGYEARIRGPDGRDAGPDEVGTLWVRGQSVAMEYWLNPEATAETFPGDDWVRTADLFRRDAEGRFWFSGRADDVLKVGGLFVSPLEVEGRLLGHPAVADCCVVPYEDAGLQKPMAFVVLREGRSPSEALALELARHVKSGLTAYKFPRRISFCGPLPRNDRGKADRKALRALAARTEDHSWFDTDPRNRARGRR